MSRGPLHPDLSTVDGMARAAGVVVGPADGEVRPEALEVLDVVRWVGVWHVVMGVQSGMTGTYLRLFDPEAEAWRTVFFRFGVWVAAKRPSLEAA